MMDPCHLPYEELLTLQTAVNQQQQFLTCQKFICSANSHDHIGAESTTETTAVTTLGACHAKTHTTIVCIIIAKCGPLVGTTTNTVLIRWGESVCLSTGVVTTTASQQCN